MSEALPTGNDHILRLPSAPVYMSIIRTLESKPVGIPIWSSFEHKEERSMSNEAIAGTLLSLTKNIADLVDDSPDGKVVRVSLDNKSYNIYTPSKTARFQISFVVVFEDVDTILVKAKFKEELVKLMVEALRKSENFINYLETGVEVQIQATDDLHQEIQTRIAKVIKKWDNKRVEYLEKKAKEERERLLALAKKEEEARIKREAELKKMEEVQIKDE
ncbi:MAG: hypothetical protein ACXAD7_08250 [Candidatus Kariarchaeaceae archaeon]|jgi:hypothetical protein